MEEEKLYSTYDEAQKVCDKLNNPDAYIPVIQIEDTSGNIEAYYEVDD